MFIEMVIKISRHTNKLKHRYRVVTKHIIDCIITLKHLYRMMNTWMNSLKQGNLS